MNIIISYHSLRKLTGYSSGYEKQGLFIYFLQQFKFTTKNFMFQSDASAEWHRGISIETCPEAVKVKHKI